MIFRRAGLSAALEKFAAAVRVGDTKGMRKNFDPLLRSVEDAPEVERAQAGPQLAELLPAVPLGPRGVVGVMIGACVEGGADPAVCAPAVLTELRSALEASVTFAEKWEATGGGELPTPDDAVTPEIEQRVGAEPVLHWWSLPQWEMATTAMLSHRSVRDSVHNRAELLGLASELSDAGHSGLQCLNHALQVLDDEPLVVLDRPSGTGYRLRMTGIGDNFQLHTLLADVLIGGGHLSGDAPTADAVAVCRNVAGQAPTKGAFNLVAPDGEWVWNEGSPADIPVVDGVRLLVLDPPPYERGWPAGRFFPGMAADLVLERVLDETETATWRTHVKP